MRRLLLYPSMLLLAFALLAGVTSPAGASGSSAYAKHLCQGFAKCAKAGYTSHGYSKVQKKRHWGMNPGTNCANYAAYMASFRGRLVAKPEGTVEARTWGAAARAAGHQVTGSPRAGDIAYWGYRKGVTGKKGHVAYVEEVHSNGMITISQDNWNKTFVVTKMNRFSRLWPSGFIRYNESDGSPAGRISKISGSGSKLHIEGWLTDPDVWNGLNSAKVTVVWGETYVEDVDDIRTGAPRTKISTTKQLPSRFRWSLSAGAYTGWQYVTLYGENTGKGKDTHLGVYQVNIRR